MNAPILLDTYSSAGGCSKGYSDAGFDVVGLDHRPQKNYPFPFVQRDALNALEVLISGGSLVFSDGRQLFLRDIDVITASPPCQLYSVANNIHGRTDHPDLIAETRRLLIATGKPYVIENVPGAPLHFPVLICGLALGLGVKRHRLFESNTMLFGTTCPEGHRGDYLNVSGHAVGEGRRGWVTVYGGGAPKVADGRRRASAELARQAMGISWMNRTELSQSVPPKYTEFLGRQLRRLFE